MVTVKQLSLFDYVPPVRINTNRRPARHLIQPPKHNTETFIDYESFVEKFTIKKTTDDCYTPKHVFDYVLKWVQDNADIDGKEILRPFYPGGDYKHFYYPENGVVIDNPPFSILSEIVKWYLAQGIKFFLFCPFLTSFIKGADCCYIIAAAEIEYANGAKVRTNFVTNLFTDRLIITGDFKCLEPAKKNLSKIELPENIVTSARLGKYVKPGVTVRISQDYNFIRNYRGVKLFGGGIILTDENTKKLKNILNK